jgi:hypothetical protein
LNRIFNPILLLCLAASPAPLNAGDAAGLWAREIQPLFDVQCVKCHGLIEKKSGLQLDSPVAVLRGGDEGRVVLPGRPEESRLYLYLAPDSDPHMPPKRQLSDGERESVRAWISALGAESTEPGPSVASSAAFDSVTEAIDGLLAMSWNRQGLRPAGTVDDRTWCRRVYLDLAGRIPTAGELDEFLCADDAIQREELVDRLLGSDEFAVRMRELWDVFLMGRPRRESHETRRRESGWWSFLENAFRSNRPWNETVRDFLAARPVSPDAAGASWFVYERRNNYQAIAEAVAPVVYGARIDCAQCHDHPLAREIQQAHYWGLVAAYNRSKNVQGSTDVAEAATGGSVNFTNLRKESQPARITLLTGLTIDEPPSIGDGKEEDRDDLYLDPTASPRVPRFSRRERFAEAVTKDNRLLARGWVNRIWAVLIGRGIVHPVDEMVARNTPSHPELLDWLADDFLDHRHDIHRLVRGIVLSRVYALQLAAAPPGSFAAAVERPLTAEQIARSWRVAMGLPPEDDVLRRAVIAAVPDVMPREYQSSTHQAQFLAASPLLWELVGSTAPGTTPARLQVLKDAHSIVREAFLCIHGRLPDAEEAAWSVAFVEQHCNTRSRAVSDLLWALMTSAEFLTMP